MTQLTCFICRKKFAARNNIEVARPHVTCSEQCYKENRKRLQQIRRLTKTKKHRKKASRSGMRHLTVSKGRKVLNGLAKNKKRRARTIEALLL